MLNPARISGNARRNSFITIVVVISFLEGDYGTRSREMRGSKGVKEACG